MAIFRLDKYLVACGIGSRSEVKNFIKAGKVKVDGSVCKSADYKFDENEVTVTYLDEEMKYTEFMYIMLNKPKDVISATTDDSCTTVIDLIKEGKHLDLFPVGRLDKDTEGLLLITNDGQLAHNLLSPKKHVDKTYYAELDGELTEEISASICKGVMMDGELTLPATITNTDDNTKVYITIQEGKYHQVKRMFLSKNLNVTYLKRMTMGSLKLDKKLKPGEYRFLTDKEIKELKGEK